MNRYRNGAAKGDVFFGPDGPVIGEIAARLSGGYMSGWTFPLSSGIELTRAALRIAMGLPVPALEARVRHTAAERAVISIDGTVEGVEGLAEAAAALGNLHRQAEIAHAVRRLGELAVDLAGHFEGLVRVP